MLPLFPPEKQEFYIAGCTLVLIPSFIPISEADRLFARLLEETPWQQSEIRIFGKIHSIPRLNSWYGERPYRYSGHQLAAQALTPALQQIQEKICSVVKKPLNSVLLNLYRNGDDSMGWHADDEPELDPFAPIASLSLGTTRRFLLREKQRGAEALEKQCYHLGHGDLVIMYPPMQTRVQHSLPKMRKISDARINLTFRKRL